MNGINYNKITGRYSFAAVGPAWHRLGKEVQSAMTTEEAMRLAGLDYDVNIVPIYAKIPQLTLGQGASMEAVEEFVEIGTNFATVHGDTKDIFGVVGSRYEVVQNTEAFNFFDEIVGQKEAIIETAGALGNGATVFITAKLPSYIKGPDGEGIEKYILLYHTHDGTSSIQAMFTPVRVVCYNTLSMALKNNSNKISLRHTKNVHTKLTEGAKLLKLTNTLSDKYAGMFKSMYERSIDEETLKYYFTNVMSLRPKEGEDKLSTRAKNILNGLLEYHEEGPGQSKIKGTVYGAYNAVTGYIANVKDYNSSEDRMAKSILGGGQAISQKAAEYAMAYVNN